MRYGFRDISFDVDPALTDETVVALVDEGKVTLTVVREKRAMALKAIVDDALRLMSTSLSGFRMLAREDKTSAVVVTSETVDPDHGPLVQHQAYVEVKDDVVVFTATAPQGGAARARAVLDQAVSSLQVNA